MAYYDETEISEENKGDNLSKMKGAFISNGEDNNSDWENVNEPTNRVMIKT